MGNQLSLDALQMRLVCMFTGEGERPQALGEPGGVPQATNGLILDALEAVRSFWGARKNEIRSCCAPAKIDQEEIRGYLLADVLDQPVLTPKDARAVGKRAYTQATAATKRLRRMQGYATAFPPTRPPPPSSARQAAKRRRRRGSAAW